MRLPLDGEMQLILAMNNLGCTSERSALSVDDLRRRLSGDALRLLIEDAGLIRSLVGDGQLLEDGDRLYLSPNAILKALSVYS